MKNFLAVFLGSDSGKRALEWDALDDKTRQSREQEGMKAWHAWVEKNKDAIVTMGAPLGSTKLVDPRGVADTTNLLTAFTVVAAENHEEAAKLFLNHPHFAIFPGDSVEVMECLPIPGM